MQLWTIQPKEIWDIICKNGVYRCNPEKCEFLQMEKDDPKFGPAYHWLVDQMEKRIGGKPEGVQLPVWAWYQFVGKHYVDLRKERWECGTDGERMVCMSIEIPEEQVLLSDFGMWHFVLNRWPISDSEEEAKCIDEYLEHTEKDEADAFLNENWEHIFDITPFENEWTSRGNDIQATFWELKRENVKKVRFFTTAKRKREIPRDY